ncbi:MAG: bifunctional phosphopantothenoylcysteine decarboxylase/phosphopantothenate--cysteine ligase CoaBC [Clostridiales bacterium]|nr:bifunctional phosphopantothenoylcysteine decarboxylase/phosphopantothenate--cysteine ligase CoaBC [Clostridiales bacterium]
MSCVVLGVTGGIAAYKSAEIASQLKKQGHDVYVIMTKHATEFIAPLTFETLTNHPVVVDMFTRETPWEVEHIALAKRADVFLVAPASANFLGKYANGIADDMLTTTVLATKAPVVLAPAMNTNMWSNAIVQKNVEALKSFGVSMVGPGSGFLACGDLGQGRMSEPEEIVEAVYDALAQKDLNGKRILVTAGPTRETVDPVRYITNHSSGKMGFAIARAAKRRGAAVTLIHGPVALPLPYGVEECAVISTQDMLEAVQDRFLDCDLLIMAAAPADFTMQEQSNRKIKKVDGQPMVWQLKQTQDILGALSSKRNGQVVVGFAAETNDVQSYAMDKLQRKRLNMIVANDVTQKGAGFGTDTNIVTVVHEDGRICPHDIAPKEEIADFILDQAKLYLK